MSTDVEHRRYHSQHMKVSPVDTQGMYDACSSNTKEHNTHIHVPVAALSVGAAHSVSLFYASPTAVQYCLPKEWIQHTSLTVLASHRARRVVQRMSYQKETHNLQITTSCFVASRCSLGRGESSQYASRMLNLQYLNNIVEPLHVAGEQGLQSKCL